MVTAAAGGTGQFAVQLAKLAGCHVIATCGGPGKAEMLRQLGLDRVIDYTKEKLKVIDRTTIMGTHLSPAGSAPSHAHSATPPAGS